MSRKGHAERERGSVLLETAFAVPVLLAVSLALVWAVSLGSTYVRALDAAQAAARAIARGAPAPDTSAIGDLSTTVDGDFVHVVISRDVSAPVPLLAGFTVRVSADAVAALEATP